jgi:hypothetical protein
MPVDTLRRNAARNGWQRRLALVRHRARRLDPTVQGLLWTSAVGLIFCQRAALARATGA